MAWQKREDITLVPSDQGFANWNHIAAGQPGGDVVKSSLCLSL